MYIYKVTYLPTREFYIGLNENPKTTFNPVKNTDPAGMFEAIGSNGTRLTINNCEKKIVKVAGDLDELIKLGAYYAKLHEKDPLFKGLIELKRNAKQEAAPKSKPINTEVSVDNTLKKESFKDSLKHNNLT